MSMDLPFGRTVYRQRPGPKKDPYSQQVTYSDWENAITVPIPNAFVAASSTSRVGDASRSQALESKSLFCEGSFDIQKDDRIRDGEVGAPIYTVDGIPPAADTNPFTGWTPPREIPLTRAVG